MYQWLWKLREMCIENMDYDSREGDGTKKNCKKLQMGNEQDAGHKIKEIEV